LPISFANVHEGAKAVFVYVTLVTMSEDASEKTQQRGALLTIRLALRRFVWAEVCAIVDDQRQPSWASDYPTHGDAVIAAMLWRAGPDAIDANVSTGDGRWGHWQVGERSTGLVVGGIGFLSPPAQGTVEIGYGIGPSRQGRGYATEAAQAVVAYAFEDGGVMAVVAGTDSDNVASQRVLEKVGFRRTFDAYETRYIVHRPA
jgi:ribosomal-protein-alanine N-acetyltransferase